MCFGMVLKCAAAAAPMGPGTAGFPHVPWDLRNNISEMCATFLNDIIRKGPLGRTGKD